MKYLEKSFTCPTSNRVMTQEQWDTIWAVKSDKKVVAALAAQGKQFSPYLTYDIYQDLVATVEPLTPPATESEKRSADTVAPGASYQDIFTLGNIPELSPGGYCPNCHCRPDSYRHTETCIEPHEAD